MRTIETWFKKPCCWMITINRSPAVVEDDGRICFHNWNHGPTLYLQRKDADAVIMAARRLDLKHKCSSNWEYERVPVVMEAQ